jgi:peroxiredoxin
MKKLAALALLAMAACATAEPPPQGAPTAVAATGDRAPSSPPAAAAAAPAAKAKVGQPAPDFSLPDLDGKTVKLADFKGKTVVLEWFNPGCPFVVQSHKAGGLKDTAARYTEKGIVWLAINSGAAGKQGHGKDTNVKAKADFAMGHPLLLDESGTVGRAYGAKHTPHMYVIDPKGILIYAGAIDSTKGGEPEKDEKVTNYVEAALAELAQSKPVSIPETEAFGCSVKY